MSGVSRHSAYRGQLVRPWHAYVRRSANVFPSLTVYETSKGRRTPSKSWSRARIEELYGLSPTCARRPGAARPLTAAAEHGWRWPGPMSRPQGPPGRRSHGRHGAKFRDGGVVATRPRSGRPSVAVVVVEQTLASPANRWAYVLGSGKTAVAVPPDHLLNTRRWSRLTSAVGAMTVHTPPDSNSRGDIKMMPV